MELNHGPTKTISGSRCKETRSPADSAAQNIKDDRWEGAGGWDSFPWKALEVWVTLIGHGWQVILSHDLNYPLPCIP